MRRKLSKYGIVKTYYLGTPNELEILHGIDLDVYEGEFLSIVGASGSGKSTLMNILRALDRPTKEQYYLDHLPMENVRDDGLSQIRNKKIGFVFQTFNPDSPFHGLKKRPYQCSTAGCPAVKVPTGI